MHEVVPELERVVDVDKKVLAAVWEMSMKPMEA